ncbi:chromosome segregation protein SMC [Nitrosomonas sp.]|uniref:chromosome segregation protein SMC n=1 Tax=Nitrosomonas sp. TaxID=42353 RepID=UPI001D2161AE|nr:chromosome segregation protein SMC [Nitrosomonas sp.]MCB1948608.1 chromosome segregation protein SMC [Nitrosomonas sp.]
MRLAKIKLAGFKSFVEPTVIPVNNDLIGIVGPNGCGKSNIIDAVRWVLGESKASALRGETMQDVIFGGTAHRKPVGRASVELVFDNSLGKANGAWSSYTEIATKRIIQRDGNSNYYINNIHVRRRDIADLFLGTGIGGRGYAIIEQGMISRIIDAKPQELKYFLEEAAGISKYRERRHETESRLTDTRKNLLRLEDISSELTKQIDHLEGQAQIAAKYNSLTQKLQETQQLLWLQHKIEIIDKRQAIETEIKAIEQTLASEIVISQFSKEQREEARTSEQQLSEQLHEQQGKLYAANADKARVEQEITQFHKHKERLSAQILDIEKQITRNQQQIDTAKDNLQHWLAESSRAQKAREEYTHNWQVENDKLPEAETTFNQCQKTFDALQHNLINTERTYSLEKTHIQHANKLIQQLESRKNRLHRESDSLTAPDCETLKNIELNSEQVRNQLSQIEKNLAQAETDYSAESERRDKIASRVHQIQKKISHLQAQFNALYNLQKKIENNDALKHWLHQHALTTSPRLWHCVHIEKEWENALESVLHERLNSLGFSQLEIVQDWENDLPPGKLSIFEFQQPDDQAYTNHQDPPVKHDNWRTLSSFLSCSNQNLTFVFDEWLRHAYVIEHLHDAIRQRHQLKPDEKFVTREGHIITRSSIYFHSPESQLHGVLSRQRELDQIRTEIISFEKQLNDQQSLLKQIVASHEALQQTIQSNQANLQQLTQQQHHLQLEKLKLSQIQEQVKQRKSTIMAELNEIEQELAIENKQKTNAEAQSTSYHNQIEAIKEHVETAKNELATARQQLADRQLKLQSHHRKIQETTFDEKICQNKISDIENSIKILNEEGTNLFTKREQISSEKNKQDDTSLKNQLNDYRTLSKQLEQSVTEIRGKLDEARNAVRTAENQLMASEQNQTTIRESLNRLFLKKQEYNLLEERYTEQLSETQAVEAKLMEFVNQKNVAAMQAEIDRINKRLAAIGTVNLAAIKELEAARQRNEALNIQIQDLIDAMSILENAIKQIDKETKKRLQETFHAVNHNLNEIFPVIFSGGKAELVLCEGTILESGLQLTAQPPGKKNNSLHLMSGGEKALTALALIFALFRLRPAPFCLLDEVDAPLDDTNTGRFCELVKKLSQQTQFLFISHNKITMEIAQQLIGITMQDQGISSVVTVDIANAVNPDRKEETALS